MVNQLNCLKAGGLVLGIVGTIVALINVFYAIAIYENFSVVDHNFILDAVIGDAPEHIIRLTYVIISIFDMVAAALLIAGILMVNRIVNNKLLPNNRLYQFRVNADMRMRPSLYTPHSHSPKSQQNAF